MRFFTIVFLFFIISYFPGWSQSLPADVAEVIMPTKYLLKAKGPSGEVFSTTGHIVKAIALSRPQSLEIAYIYLNYIATVKLNTDVSGETTAIVSFHSVKLSGDLVYKGFDIENHIFPSLVKFRLILPGAAKGAVTAKQVLAIVTSANVNSGDCSVSIALHKKITVMPVIDKLAFYHSEDDLEKADNQMMLIDRYYVAGSLMQRTEKLLDAMQYAHLHQPSVFIAANLEVIMLNDWIIRQHFNRYPVFQKNDTLSLAKRMIINRFRKKLIDQDFIKLNVIRNEDLLKAANLFATNLADYFDAGQPDVIRATYISQMAASGLSSIGYKAIRDFADGYSAVHKHCKVDWRMFVTASTMIRHAMTVQASLLADNEHFSEAMGLLNASDNYDLQTGVNHSSADSILIGKLSQRLYNANLDIAIKSLNVGMYRVANDYYQKALLLKQTYDGMITPDSRERYVADMVCKAMLISAGNSFKSNDIETALATYEQVIRLADAARLKNAYETARTRLGVISNRPSGYKPWNGVDLAVIVPVKKIVRSKDMALTFLDKNGKVSTSSLAGIKERLLVKTAKQKTKDSLLLAANTKNFKAMQQKLPIVLVTDIQPFSPPKNVLPTKKVKTKKKLPQADSVKADIKKIVTSLNISDIKEQINANIKSIHLEIWSGDSINSALLINKTDSLQQLLAQTGNNGFAIDIRVLRINYDEMRCEQQKTAYLRDLDQIRNLLRSKDFSLAGKQLQELIAKNFSVSCKVDKTEAIRLLSTLESPLVYKRWIIQLDSITKTQEPESIIEAFEKAREYYRINMLDKLGMESPDLMAALKSRNETSFLLKAVTQLLNTNRPAYALELLKEIHLLEPKPDKTFSVQKRLGEMLASGDYSTEHSFNDTLKAYNINNKWYDELLSAYKKQWNIFAR